MRPEPTIPADAEARKPGPPLSADEAKLLLMQMIETFGPDRVKVWFNNLAVAYDGAPQRLMGGQNGE